MARTLSAKEKKARIVQPKAALSGSARRAAVKRATSKVKARTDIDFVSAVRG